jgi:hypothetical protein
MKTYTQQFESLRHFETKEIESDLEIHIPYQPHESQLNVSYIFFHPVRFNPTEFCLMVLKEYMIGLCYLASPNQPNLI